MGWNMQTFLLRDNNKDIFWYLKTMKPQSGLGLEGIPPNSKLFHGQGQLPADQGAPGSIQPGLGHFQRWKIPQRHPETQKVHLNTKHDIINQGTDGKILILSISHSSTIVFLNLWTKPGFNADIQVLLVRMIPIKNISLWCSEPNSFRSKKAENEDNDPKNPKNPTGNEVPNKIKSRARGCKNSAVQKPQNNERFLAEEEQPLPPSWRKI